MMSIRSVATAVSTTIQRQPEIVEMERLST